MPPWYPGMLPWYPGMPQGGMTAALGAEPWGRLWEEAAAQHMVTWGCPCPAAWSWVLTLHHAVPRTLGNHGSPASSVPPPDHQACKGERNRSRGYRKMLCALAGHSPED